MKFGDAFEYKPDTMRRFFTHYIQNMKPADFDKFVDDNFSDESLRQNKG